eukprot:COSAG02_NODE_37943_length_435_cov_1.044643_1_plen_80_part_10
MSTASCMYSTASTICVQLASLLSRTPSAAEMDRPLAQMPWKPASSTILAESPFCAAAFRREIVLHTGCRMRCVRAWVGGG